MDARQRRLAKSWRGWPRYQTDVLSRRTVEVSDVGESGHHKKMTALTATHSNLRHVRHVIFSHMSHANPCSIYAPECCDMCDMLNSIFIRDKTLSMQSSTPSPAVNMAFYMSHMSQAALALMAYAPQRDMCKKAHVASLNRSSRFDGIPFNTPPSILKF